MGLLHAPDHPVCVPIPACTGHRDVLGTTLPSSHPSSPHAWHRSPEETRLLMSSSLADPGGAVAAQPRSSFLSHQIPLECFKCFTLPSPLPPVPLCSPSTARRPRGFDHLRLFNPDLQLPSISRTAKKERSPFSFFPFCLRALNTLLEPLCPIPLSIPPAQSPLCAGLGSSQPGLQAQAYL